MMTVELKPTSDSARAWRWVVIGALVAGTFDISYAIGFSYWRNGTSPIRLLQYVASGALGAAAFRGGMPTALAGLGFHYLNAFLFAAAFFAAAAMEPRLARNPLGVGTIYGVGIYAVMNYVVVPLSRIGPRPTPPTDVWATGLLVHMLLIGVPIAFAARCGLRQAVASARPAT